MASARGSQLKVAFHPAFATQVDFDTPLDTATLTKVFQCTSPNHIEPQKTIKSIFDCTQQYKIGNRILKRGARLRLELEVDAKTLHGLLALAFGATAAPASLTSGISMLGPKTFAVPVTTVVVGYDDGSDPGVILKCCAVNSISINGRTAETVKVTVELVGSGDLQTATGFTFPNCTDLVPVYFEDGALTINSVDRFLGDTPNKTTWEFNFTYSNNLALQDAAPMNKVDYIRLERGEVREYGCTWKVEGRVMDSLHALAHQATTNNSFSFRVGTTTNGVTITCAAAEMLEGSPLQTHEGEVRRAVLNLVLNPLRVSSNAATPLVASATYTGNTTQLLLAA
jgi:hypothetical protein